MASRGWARAYTLGTAALHWGGRRERAKEVRRLLIVQHFLLGDTIMLTPLLKKARELYPAAEIDMALPSAYAPLYAGRPYGVRALPFDVRSLATHRALRRHAGYDLALVPGDNRWAWLARALESRWIVAFAADEPGYHEWPVDELRPMPSEPMAWGDIAARLLDGPEPQPYSPEEWPAPPFRSYNRPPSPYCIIHPGAGNPNRLWPQERWRAVIERLEQKGHRILVTGGPGEEGLASALDPEGTRSSLAGRLDLPQLWNLLSGASFLICPDTGIAHLARVVGVPTVSIYGQGSPISTGPGRFWAQSRFTALWDENVPCRDDRMFFGRRLEWLRQCARRPSECADPYCIRRVDVQQVIEAVDRSTNDLHGRANERP